ncbi:MAG TPA: hypothetical protein VGI86_21925 [Acidimicrobiia bacterium]
MRHRSLVLTLVMAVMVASATAVGASTVQQPTHLAVGAATSASQVEANTTGTKPAWADVSSPFASSVKANTYGSVTGYNPLPQACGDTNPVNVLGAMYQLVLIGVSQVRCDLNWWSVQPTNASTYYWSTYDNVVNAAAHFGITVLFTVGYTPPWARPNPLPAGTSDPSHVPPVHVNDFVRFVAAAVNRYSPVGRARVSSVVGSVSEWEIWNEPNLSGGWTPADPVRYGNFLHDVAWAIHRLDHKAIVISGGMAPAGNTPGNYSPQTFIADMVPTGVFKQVNGIGIHPYTFPAYPNEKLNFNPFYNAVPAIYYVMLVYGLGNLKIWATEIGWPTSSASPQSYRFWDGIQVGTEAYQAVELPLTIKTWFTFPYAGPLFLYAERDKCSDNTQWLCKMGIERPDGSHKPAYATVHAQLLKPLP